MNLHRIAFSAGLLALGLLLAPAPTKAAGTDLEDQMLLTDGSEASVVGATPVRGGGSRIGATTRGGVAPPACPGGGTSPCPCPGGSSSCAGKPKPVICPPAGGTVTMGPAPGNTIPIKGKICNMPGPGKGGPTAVCIVVITTNKNGCTVQTTTKLCLSPGGCFSGPVGPLGGCYYGCVLIIAKPVKTQGAGIGTYSAGCPSCRVGVTIKSGSGGTSK